MSDEVNTQKNERKGRGLGLLALVSAIIIPLCLLAFTFYGILTDSSFYARILKKADIISTFIQTRNTALNAKINAEIENELHLDAERNNFAYAKDDYEEKKDIYNALNKTDEFDQLKQERKETNKLEWKNVSHLFNSKDEFNNYKKKELGGFDSKMDEIKTYRKANKAAISNAEKIMDAAEDKFNENRKTLEKKEKKALEMLASQGNTLTGKIFSDIETIKPELTEVLNNTLIDVSVKGEIDKLILFTTTRDQQLKDGKIFYESPDVGRNTAGIGELKIRLPQFVMSLMVEENSSGLKGRRHLLSDVFVEIIKSKKGLYNKELFIKIFKYSESGMAEIISNLFLNDAGFSLRGNSIIMDPVVLSGSAAYRFDKVMKVASMQDLFRIVLPILAAVFLLLLLIYPAPLRRRLRTIRAVLLYPSFLIVVTCVVVIVLSWTSYPMTFLPESMSNEYMLAYVRSAVSSVPAFLLFPVMSLFALMALAGIILGVFVRKKK